MRILHVVHHLGAGLETAVADYVRATPEHEHHLFASPDPSCAFGHRDVFASETTTSLRLPTFVRDLRRRVRDLVPDVVHAHSSYAGALTRVFLARGRTGCPVVYTPHCFAFERRDIGPVSRGAYWAIEAVLARRTSTIAACSPREAELAERIQDHVVYVPNVARLGPATEDDPITVAKTYVTCGRIAPQKDPLLFAEIAERVPGEHEWIGGGDPELTRQLEDVGVSVTGWLDRAAALDRVRRAAVYIHTAGWEGAPMTILEAAALDKPVIARDTPATRALGCAPLWNTVDELVDILADDDSLDLARRRSAEITRTHSPGAQARTLADVYRTARTTTTTTAAARTASADPRSGTTVALATRSVVRDA